jgi:hypothetical protein
MIPVGIYVLWFVSPKPDHYLMPLLVPLYATAASGFDLFSLGWVSKKTWVKWITYAGSAAYVLILVYQCAFQISRYIQQYVAYFNPM